MALATELYDLAERIGERELKMLGLHWRIWDLLEMGEVDAARYEWRRLTALADELRLPTYRFYSARWEVVWAGIADRLDEIPGLIDRSLELGQAARAAEVEVETGGQRLCLAYRYGALGQFVDLLDAEYKANPQIFVNLPALALARLQGGHRESGLELFEQMATNDFGHIEPPNMLWLASMVVLAEVAALAGDEARARTLYGILEPHRNRNVLIGLAACWGSAERFLGLLAGTYGDYDTAAAHFETAITRNHDGGIDSMFEMVRREYADLLERRGAPGDAERAAALRAETLATAPAPIAATQVERPGSP